MSNELKRVQERLFKKPEPVELSAEKVELKNISELKSAIKYIESDIKDMIKAEQQNEDALVNYNKTKRRIIELVNSQITPNIKSINQTLLQFENTANDLGLNPDSISEYSDVKKKLKEVESTANTLLALTK